MVQASTTALHLGHAGPRTASCRTGRATSASASIPRTLTLWPRCCNEPVASCNWVALHGGPSAGWTQHPDC